MGYVIGINCSGFHASACLVEDGRIRAAICEERLSRIKRDKAFPLRALRYCCEEAGIAFDAVEDVFIGWHPRHYLRQSDKTLNDALRARGKLSYLAMNELATLGGGELRDVAACLRSEHGAVNIHFIDHHLAHLANGYYQSGYGDADFLMLDGFGEVCTGICGRVRGGETEILASYPSPHSLGSFYSAFTDYLGFHPDGDEWKVMALSALGDPEPYYERIRALVKSDGLAFELDLSYFEHYLFFKPKYYAEKLVTLLGPPLAPGAEATQREWDIVAAVQRVTEECVFELLSALHARTGGGDVVLGGGVFMNSVCNGKLLANTPYQRCYIGGSPDDSGVALGSALYGAHTALGGAPAGEAARHNYFGKTYGNDAIRAELERRKLRCIEVEDAPGKAAELLADGKILGWFQGGSEFGQRALGNRSILADPRNAAMKDAVNASVKYREGFRPFAPAILAERQDEVLEGATGQTSHFMEKVFPIAEAWRARVPAVTHFDGTGRPQTVERDINPRFHALISAFAKRTDVPLVLNTSFNVNGMPLVESPADALDCFYACGLDALVLGDFLVEK